MEDVTRGEDRNLASQCIIDLTSEQVCSLFTYLEWEEIQKEAKPRSNPVLLDINIPDVESLMAPSLRVLAPKHPQTSDHQALGIRKVDI